METKLTFCKSYLRQQANRSYFKHRDRLSLIRPVLQATDNITDLEIANDMHRRRKRFDNLELTSSHIHKYQLFKMRISGDSTHIPKPSTDEFSKTQIALRQVKRIKKQRLRQSENIDLSKKLVKVHSSFNMRQVKKQISQNQLYRNLISQKSKIGMKGPQMPSDKNCIFVEECSMLPLPKFHYQICLQLLQLNFRLRKSDQCLFKLGIEFCSQKRSVKSLTNRQFLIQHLTRQCTQQGVTIVQQRTWTKVACGQDKNKFNMMGKSLSQQKLENPTLFIFRGGFLKCIPADKLQLTATITAITPHQEIPWCRFELQHLANEPTTADVHGSCKKIGTVEYKCLLRSQYGHPSKIDFYSQKIIY